MPQHGPYYRQPWEGLKETTPIISGGMNALLLSAFLDEPRGNQVFGEINECIPEFVKAMRVCIKETGEFGPGGDQGPLFNIFHS